MQIGKITNTKSIVAADKWQLLRSFGSLKSCLSKAIYFISCWHNGNRDYDGCKVTNFLFYSLFSPVNKLGESSPLFFLKTNHSYKDFLKLSIYKG